MLSTILFTIVQYTVRYCVRLHNAVEPGSLTKNTTVYRILKFTENFRLQNTAVYRILKVTEHFSLQKTGVYIILKFTE